MICESSGVVSWCSSVAYNAALAVQTVVGLTPKPPPMIVDTSASMWFQKGSTAILTSIQPAGVPPEVNLGITQVRKLAKGIYHCFETRGKHYQKSKTGVSVASLMSSKNFKKKFGSLSFRFYLLRCRNGYITCSV